MIIELEDILKGLDEINNSSLSTNDQTLKEVNKKILEVKTITKSLVLPKGCEQKIEEISSIVKNFLDVVLIQKMKLEETKKKLEKEKEKTKKLVKKREELYLDQLTKIGNRHKYNQISQELLLNYKENNIPFSLALIDIDNFKKINDTYGHDIGDKTLIALANFLRKNLKEDYLFRFGGEEFIILSTKKDKTELKNYLNSLLMALENKVLMLNKEKKEYIKISFSGGVTEIKDKESNYGIKELEKEADLKLYEAKKMGKNKVL